MYQPSSDLNTAFARADMYRRIRSFFGVKQVLEVETPILSHAGTSDVHLQSVRTQFSHQDSLKTGYLHTSPEFAMKRLLAAWQQPIYQITKAFRDNECGKKHNIEFSMLEWYRPDMSLDELADELADLLTVLFGQKVIFNRISYQQAFLDYADVEPFTATVEELEQVAMLHGIDSTLSQPREYISVMASDKQGEQQQESEHQKDMEKADTEIAVPQKMEGGVSPETLTSHNPYGYTYPVSTDIANSNELPETLSDDTAGTHCDSGDSMHKLAWLDLLYSQLVEPKLGKDLPTLIYDFPVEQAALAKTATNAEGNLVAKRFELYINGIELANAYDELIDANTQRQRFEADNAEREKQGLATMPIDENLLAALSDMPACSGISVGLDRLLMVILDKPDISDVINFTIDRA